MNKIEEKEDNTMKDKTKPYETMIIQKQKHWGTENPDTIFDNIHGIEIKDHAGKPVSLAYHEGVFWLESHAPNYTEREQLKFGYGLKHDELLTKAEWYEMFGEDEEQVGQYREDVGEQNE